MKDGRRHGSLPEVERMTLDQARPGSELIIGQPVGRGRNRRLYDLGLTPGTRVEIVASHPFRGPVIVRAHDALIAVGRSLARLIPCAEADPSR